MINNSYQKGFTLIETLVAISILMIAIAGPLTIASKAYTSAIDAKNQAMASNYAQETMEYLNNLKDNRYAPGGWNDWDLESGNSPRILSDCPSTSPCNFTVFEALPSQFTSRRYYAEPGYTDNQIKVFVVVTWRTGLLTNQVQLQQMLSNSQR